MLPRIDSITQGVSAAAGYEAPARQETEKPVQTTPTRTETEPERKMRQKATETFPAREQRDQVDIHFTLSREEREAFAAALSNRKNPDGEMTEEEKQTVQKASERITKFIDATIARNQQSREKVEKAVSEWYSKLSRDEPSGPFDLIQLLREAAMGNLDEAGK